MSAKPVTMSLGEVLWDILPDGKSLGGAPTNAAWHLAQLGADAHVVSAVGEDALGGEILDRLRAKHLNVETIVTIKDKPTSTVEARLSPEGNATYVIHEDVAWDHMPVSDDILAIARKCQAVNFGSLAQRGDKGRQSTRAILDATPTEAIRVFDINLRPPFIHKEVLADGLARAAVVKMNETELPVLAELFGWSDRPEAAIEEMLGKYANLAHAVITRGPEGAWWHDRKRLIKRKPTSNPKVQDTIGAGDSVTASTMMGLLKGWEADRILETALEIASFVVSSRGGMPELPASLKNLFA